MSEAESDVELTERRVDGISVGAVERRRIDGPTPNGGPARRSGAMSSSAWACARKSGAGGASGAGAAAAAAALELEVEPRPTRAASAKGAAAGTAEPPRCFHMLGAEESAAPGERVVRASAVCSGVSRGERLGWVW